MKDRHVLLPILFLSVILISWVYLTGCAVSANLMTHSQYQAQTRDRVQIDRRYGDYDKDGFTLQEFRKRNPAPYNRLAGGQTPSE